MAEKKPDKPNNPNQNRDTLRYRKSEKINTEVGIKRNSSMSCCPIIISSSNINSYNKFSFNTHNNTIKYNTLH